MDFFPISGGRIFSFDSFLQEQRIEKTARLKIRIFKNLKEVGFIEAGFFVKALKAKDLYEFDQYEGLLILILSGHSNPCFWRGKCIRQVNTHFLNRIPTIF